MKTQNIFKTNYIKNITKYNSKVFYFDFTDKSCINDSYDITCLYDENIKANLIYNVNSYTPYYSSSSSYSSSSISYFSSSFSSRSSSSSFSLSSNSSSYSSQDYYKAKILTNSILGFWNFQRPYSFNEINLKGTFDCKPGLIGTALDLTEGKMAIIEDKNRKMNFSKDNFSISFWIKSNQDIKENESVWIISKQQKVFPNLGWKLGLTKTDGITRVIFNMFNSPKIDGFSEYINSNNINIISEETQSNCLMNNNWNHILLTKAENYLYIYVNGHLVLEFFKKNSFFPDANGQDIEIGGISNGENYFEGLIEQLGLWNRTLQEEEISWIYRRKIGFEMPFYISSSSSISSSISSKSSKSSLSSSRSSSSSFSSISSLSSSSSEKPKTKIIVMSIIDESHPAYIGADEGSVYNQDKLSFYNFKYQTQGEDIKFLLGAVDDRLDLLFPETTGRPLQSGDITALERGDFDLISEQLQAIIIPIIENYINVDLIFIIDNSGSMRVSDVQQGMYLFRDYLNNQGYNVNIYFADAPNDERWLSWFEKAYIYYKGVLTE